MFVFIVASCRVSDLSHPHQNNVEFHADSQESVESVESVDSQESVESVDSQESVERMRAMRDFHKQCTADAWPEPLVSSLGISVLVSHRN